MAWVDKIFRLSPTNILVGLGVALAAPVLVPALAAVIRPVVKAAIKGGMAAGTVVAAKVTEAGEHLSDLYAEAKAEHEAGAASPEKPSYPE